MSRRPHPEDERSQCTKQISSEVFREICSLISGSDEFAGVAECLGANPVVLCNAIAVSTEYELDWSVEQDKDKVLHRVVELVKGQTKLTERQRQKELPPVRKLLAYWDNLVLHDGVLYKESVVKGSLVPRLVVPWHWQQEVLCLSHDKIGHLGREKTINIAYDRYFLGRFVTGCQR